LIGVVVDPGDVTGCGFAFAGTASATAEPSTAAMTTIRRNLDTYVLL
jgi:hypothetical protein